MVTLAASGLSFRFYIQMIAKLSGDAEFAVEVSKYTNHNVWWNNYGRAMASLIGVLGCFLKMQCRNKKSSGHFRRALPPASPQQHANGGDCIVKIC